MVDIVTDLVHRFRMVSVIWELVFMCHVRSLNKRGRRQFIGGSVESTYNRMLIQ